jgi:hypothetical protein
MPSDKVKQVTSVSHTACVGGTRNEYRILTWKSVWKRHFGVDIFWRRCKGGKYESKDAGCVDVGWIQLAQFGV